MQSEIERKSMVNTTELRQIFPLRENTLRHVVEGDGRYPRAMTPSDTGDTNDVGSDGHNGRQAGRFKQRRFC